MHTKVLLVLVLCAGLATAWAGAGNDTIQQPGAQPGVPQSDSRAPVTALALVSPTATTVADGPATISPPLTVGQRPATTEQPPPRRERLVISGAGDTNLDPNYIPAFRTEGYPYAFTGLQDIFHDDDLTIVNFECASSALGAPVPKTFNFNCDTAALPAMKAAGIEVASIANNHGKDYGEEALLDTKANLLAAGLAPVGVGRNAAEAAAPALFEVRGWKIAVVGFNGVIPDPSWIAGPDHPGMADGDTIETMVETVKAADEVADLVFVIIHWGVELDTTPRPDDVERAHAMIEAGADVIFGSHSHRLNPLEMIDGKPVAWGLGNFVWPRLSDAGATSAIAQVIIEPDGTTTACLVPVFIERNGHPVVQVDYQGDCRW